MTPWLSCVARGFFSSLHCENPGALKGKLTKVGRCPPKTRPLWSCRLSNISTLSLQHYARYHLFSCAALVPMEVSAPGLGLVTCDSLFAPALGPQLAQWGRSPGGVKNCWFATGSALFMLRGWEWQLPSSLPAGLGIRSPPFLTFWIYVFLFFID